VNVTVNSSRPLTIANLTFNGTIYNMHKDGFECWYNVTNLADGDYSYKVDGKDPYGSNSTEVRTVTVKAVVPPSLSFIFPTPVNGKILFRDWVNITIETNKVLAQVTLKFDNATYNMNKKSDTIWWYNFSNLKNGEYFYNVTGVDNDNLTNVTETRNVFIISYVGQMITVIPSTPDIGCVGVFIALGVMLLCIRKRRLRNNATN